METDSSALKLFRLFDDGEDDNIVADLAAIASQTDRPPPRGLAPNRSPNVDR
ncbi:hypothetical protein PI125_g21172 [Phytophthora idaei]|nr:hypothetical protein PI125_g21172 [Phytophthora idaei]